MITSCASRTLSGRCARPAKRGEFLRARPSSVGAAQSRGGRFGALAYTCEGAKAFPDADFVLMEPATDCDRPFGPRGKVALKRRPGPIAARA